VQVQFWVFVIPCSTTTSQIPRNFATTQIFCQPANDCYHANVLSLSASQWSRWCVIKRLSGGAGRLSRNSMPFTFLHRRNHGHPLKYSAIHAALLDSTCSTWSDYATLFCDKYRFAVCFHYIVAFKPKVILSDGPMTVMCSGKRLIGESRGIVPDFEVKMAIAWESGWTSVSTKGGSAVIYTWHLTQSLGDMNKE
jgi:hypothetical protein